MTASARARRAWPAAIAVALLALGCGKKGPPLPPLVQLPAAPADVAVTRRGSQVDIRFKVPRANTDGVTPASLGRVEVYALTADGPAPADEVLRRGVRVASVSVNEPRDPDEPPPPDEARPASGVEQDSVATLTETIGSAGVSGGVRSYVAVGLNRRGRRGAIPERVVLPLQMVPPPAEKPEVTYDEASVRIAWPAAADPGPDAALRYVVYQGSDLLTPEPLSATAFAHKSIEWGQERCYAVRTVFVLGPASSQGESSPEACVTLRDTFPPKAPEGLVSVAGEGAISLIWSASAEADLLGYLVLRAIAPSTQLVPVTPLPTRETNFRDTVPRGARVTYAIQAIDRAGNRSVPSASITETAR